MLPCTFQAFKHIPQLKLTAHEKQAGSVSENAEYHIMLPRSIELPLEVGQ